ncbi:MAG TPA: hypothetical protein EYP29_02385 [Thermoplasmata archaeon]|nr:hypothetical protein [Thermoplasmata archaeon]
MRELSLNEIKNLASRPKAKRIAVENFLFSMADLSEREALYNLVLDARFYGWNLATIKAIKDGIKLASGGRK